MCTGAGHVGNVVDTLRGIILDAPEYHGLVTVGGGVSASGVLNAAGRDRGGGLAGIQVHSICIAATNHRAPLALLELNLRRPGIVVADGTLVLTATRGWMSDCRQCEGNTRCGGLTMAWLQS